MNANNLINFLIGNVVFNAVEGFCERLINLCAKENIILYDLVKTPEGFKAKTSSYSFKKILILAKKVNVSINVEKKSGVPFIIKKYKKRGGILVGILIFLAFFTISKNYIWQINIEGNKKIDKNIILEELEFIGIKKFSKIKNIDSVKSKEELLLNIPQLSWITINIEGCKANVIVSERIAPPKIKSTQPCDIIAKKTGQIIYIDCYSGTIKVKVGNSVCKGETIISNEVTLKNGGIINVHSDAKIIAQTQYDKTVEFDLVKHNKEYTNVKKKRRYLNIFSLKMPMFISNKLNGNYDISEKKSDLTFFGKKLPFAITTKTYSFYNIKKDEILQKEVKKILLDILSQYETTELIDASIINKTDNYKISNEKIELTRSYVVEENIAQEVPVS